MKPTDVTQTHTTARFVMTRLPLERSAPALALQLRLYIIYVYRNSARARKLLSCMNRITYSICFRLYSSYTCSWTKHSTAELYTVLCELYCTVKPYSIALAFTRHVGSHIGRPSQARLLTQTFIAVKARHFEERCYGRGEGGVVRGPWKLFQTNPNQTDSLTLLPPAPLERRST